MTGLCWVTCKDMSLAQDARAGRWTSESRPVACMLDIRKSTKNTVGRFLRVPEIKCTGKSNNGLF